MIHNSKGIHDSRFTIDEKINDYLNNRENKMKTRFKPKYNIKKGDSVVIIAGNDKDLAKPRTVKQVLIDEAKVIVEGVNIISRHTKPSAQNTKGGIVKKEAPIHIS